MAAVEFSISIPRFLVARTLGRLSDWFLFGAPSGLSLVERPALELPGPEWVALEPIATGVCGSDLSFITFDGSTTLEPFASFPAVPGHEILARVARTGPRVTRVREGDRVVLDPTLSCAARGYDEPCASCAEGFWGTCARQGDAGPTLGRGMFIGAHKDLPGGWSTSLVAHESQLFVVPDAVSDDAAVLCEPLSVAMHALSQHPPEGARSVLVIGSGPIAFGALFALRALGYEGTVVAQTKRSYEADLAKKLGATSALTPAEARAALLETGARAYKTILGEEVYAGGGFPLILDCVGSRESMTQAMRWCATRGTIILLGCAAEISKLDMSFLWAREITMRGFVCYGRERSGRHTFELTLDALAKTRAPVKEMITHRFPLARYGEALSAGANRAKSGAMKILLTPS